MFRVTVTNGELKKNFLWLNQKDDDFIRYLPEHFGVDISQISVSYIKNGWGEKKTAETFLTDEEKQLGVEVNFSLMDDKVLLIKSYVHLVKEDYIDLVPQNQVQKLDENQNPIEGEFEDVPPVEVKKEREVPQRVNALIKELTLIDCYPWPYEDKGRDSAGVHHLIFKKNFEEQT